MDLVNAEGRYSGGRGRGRVCEGPIPDRDCWSGGLSGAWVYNGDSIDNSVRVHGRCSGCSNTAGLLREREFNNWLDSIATSARGYYEVVHTAARNGCGIESSCGVATRNRDFGSSETESGLNYRDVGEDTRRDLSYRTGLCCGSYTRRGNRNDRCSDVAIAWVDDGYGRDAACLRVN